MLETLVAISVCQYHSIYFDQGELKYRLYCIHNRKEQSIKGGCEASQKPATLGRMLERTRVRSAESHRSKGSWGLRRERLVLRTPGNAERREDLP